MKIENGLFINGYDTIPIRQITQAGIYTTEMNATPQERSEFRQKRLQAYRPRRQKQLIFSAITLLPLGLLIAFLNLATGILIGILWLIIALIIWSREPWELPRTVLCWGIKITTSAGTTEVFFSRNKNFIEKVHTAFQDAIRAEAEGKHANSSWNVNNYHIDKVEYQDYSDNSVTNNITNEYVNNTYEGISPDEMKFLLGEFSQQMESVAKAINNSNNELLSTTFAELKAELKNEKPSPKGIKGCLDRLRSASEGMDIYENVDKLIEYGARAIMMFTV